MANQNKSNGVKSPKKTKEPTEMTHAEKLKLIDEELNSFYK